MTRIATCAVAAALALGAGACGDDGTAEQEPLDPSEIPGSGPGGGSDGEDRQEADTGDSNDEPGAPVGGRDGADDGEQPGSGY